MKKAHRPFSAAEDKLLREWVARYRHLGESGNRIYELMAKEHPQRTPASWRERYVRHIKLKDIIELARIEGLKKSSNPSRTQNSVSPQSSKLSSPPLESKSEAEPVSSSKQDSKSDTPSITSQRSQSSLVEPSRYHPNEAAARLPTPMVDLATSDNGRSNSIDENSDRESKEDMTEQQQNRESTVELEENIPQTSQSNLLQALSPSLSQPSSPKPSTTNLRGEQYDFDAIIANLSKQTAMSVEDCIRVLSATSNDFQFAYTALLWLRRHPSTDNTLPPGCWTAQDDALLQQSTNSEEIHRLIKRKGTEILQLLSHKDDSNNADSSHHLEEARQSLTQSQMPIGTFVGDTNSYISTTKQQPRKRKVLEMLSDVDEDSTEPKMDAITAGYQSMALRLLMIETARQKGWQHVVALC